MAHSGTIVYMRTVPGQPKMRALTAPLPCMKQDGTWEDIPIDYMSDGSSVPWLFQGIFPRHEHPIAFFRHDWRCDHAKNAAERKFADDEFEIDVGTTSSWVIKKIGYAGVRIGACFGIGNNF